MKRKQKTVAELKAEIKQMPKSEKKSAMTALLKTIEKIDKLAAQHPELGALDGKTS